MHPFFRFLTALSEGYFVSSATSFGQEVAAGGTTNKVWTGLIQVVMIVVIYSPLEMLFPATLLLPLAYYTLIALTIGLTYIASVCHQNQVLRATGDPATIQKLPYGLHESHLFSRAALFLSMNFSYVLYATYTSVLLLCIYSGLYLFPVAVISMVITDQLYQQRWFPKFMETPYFLISNALQIFVALGFSNWFWTGLSLINVAFFAWDYVQTHLRGVQSASSQFPIASKKQQLTFDDLLNLKTKHPTNKAELDLILDKFKNPAIRTTFNHFREASLVIDRLIGNAPTIDFNEFENLFNKLDFQDPKLRNLILNEMALNDKFHSKELDDHRKALDMDENADNIDIQIAYLKQEMKHAVTKLISPLYKSLDHQQVNTMIGQARLVLDFALKCTDETEQRNILLSVAIQAGSQCFRQFSETFAELFHTHAYKDAPLCLKDKAALVAQSVREVKFKDYYYHVYEPLKLFNMATYNIETLLTADKNDYHAYENFAVQYGQFFYLQNQTLSQRARGIYDVISDYSNTYIFWPLIESAYNKTHPVNTGLTQKSHQNPPKKCLFSDHYNAESLIQSSLSGSGSTYKNGEKNFYIIFEAWCNSIYPNAYYDFTLDEDFYPIPATDPRLRALVKIMLLDLELAELVPLKQETLLSTLSDCKNFISSRFPRVTAFVSQVMSYLHQVLTFVGTKISQLIFTAEQIEKINQFLDTCISTLEKWFALPLPTEDELIDLKHADDLLKDIAASKNRCSEPSTYNILDYTLGRGEKNIPSTEQTIRPPNSATGLDRFFKAKNHVSKSATNDSTLGSDVCTSCH